MDVRVLRYFLAVAREESISGAAEYLHLSQPTLSRQLMDLEKELGKPLFIRGSRKITLTEQGILLRKRASEIMDLVDKTTAELTAPEDAITGEIYIGAGETDGVHFLTRTARKVQQEYPKVHFHIASGDTVDVTEQLDKGLIDFGLLFEPIDTAKYGVYHLPVYDVWGVLMRRDSPLAQKSAIEAADLVKQPLIMSRLMGEKHPLNAWFRKNVRSLNVVATYSLLYNASLMVEDGLGYALCLGGIINTSGDSCLCFRPLAPEIAAHMGVVWKKSQVFSRASEKFLVTLQEVGSERSAN